MSALWLFLTVGLAFFLAWNLGANDVANAMGTSVGSKVVTLRQAIVLAGILELSGAVFFGREVTATLTGKVASIQLFEGQPQLFVLSIVAELLSTGLWLLFATWRGWPVASSHAAVSAIAAINLLAFGLGALKGSTIRTILLTWLLTPFASGLVSAAFFLLLQRGLLQQKAPAERWQDWTPWISVAVVSLVGGLVLPTVVAPLAALAEARWHWSLPHHDYALGIGALGALGLTFWTTRTLPETRASEGDPLEGQLGKFQLVSACCMAFAHGSNDVGNAVAPLASFVQLWQTQTLPVAEVAVPLWILAVGGIGIVTGLATWGKRVIATVGERLTALQPSYGFCAELGAAATVLLASRWGLPVSTTHALVGSVVGIGLVRGTASLQWSMIRQIAAAWFVTVPASMVLAGVVFGGLRSLALML
ncbi:inorganic phosphate transporter [Altericista sp. CCNU0014]|uniref:inorganic phosphate transporter n=1 Tax=Altericista sp. CCNU0014 TaxID=3082949 RepID=UPI0038515D65